MPCSRKYLKRLEARVGFEPTNGGFADLSLGPLGYRAELLSIAKINASVRVTPGISGETFCYFLPAGTGVPIFASRRKRADSSGGVGLM